VVIGIIVVLVIVLMICEWRHGFPELPKKFDEEEVVEDAEGGERGTELQDWISTPIMTSGVVVDGERQKHTDDGLVVHSKSNSTRFSGSSKRAN
jgi:hypothetical protein